MPDSHPAGLPAPDADSAAHSERCAHYISERIRASGGSISFAEFMHHALYAPGLGYYVAGNRKFGASGDFITAPEVSSLFSRVLATQCAGVLDDVGGDSILEIGAGSGRLAVDVLQKLDEIVSLPGEYLILEISPELTARQSALLRESVPQHYGRVRWVETLPGNLKGVVIANEVADALPVERFETGNELVQMRVKESTGGFAWERAAAPRALVDAVTAIEDDLGHRLPTGYRSECSLAAPAWVTDVISSLSAGAFFLFDYGLERRAYYAADRSEGFLRCHFRHHAHDDPLWLPGIQDITAWVDFSALALAAHQAGADIAGFLPQAQFLLEGGLPDELHKLAELRPAERVSLSGQVKTLTLPGEMGERFKCLAMSKGLSFPPAVFRRADRAMCL